MIGPCDDPESGTPCHAAWRKAHAADHASSAISERRSRRGKFFEPGLDVRGAPKLRQGVEIGEVPLEESEKREDVDPVAVDGAWTQSRASNVEISFQTLMEGVTRSRELAL